MIEQYDILQTHKQLQPALEQIAEHLKNSGAAKIKLQCGDVVITAEYGSTLDGLTEHQCTYAIFASESMKKCVDCGNTQPLFDLEIKHQR